MEFLNFAMYVMLSHNEAPSMTARKTSKNNLGQTSLKRRARRGNPMSAYDQLPRELRLWMQNAKMPWSAASCQAVWKKTQARGGAVAECLERLERAEAATLAREGGRPGRKTTPKALFRC